MRNRAPVILIGFDAAEIEVIDQLVIQGRMPQMAKLRQRGLSGRVQTQPPYFLSLVWPTFFCSAGIGDHAWYYNKIWNPDRQRVEYVNPTWLPVRPFWLSLDNSYRVVLLDLPYAAGMPTAGDTALINGWQCHDHFGRMQVPPGLWSKLVARHGQPCMTPEVFGPQTAATLLALREEVLNTTRQFGAICLDFVTNDRFDLFLAVFGAAHRGSHYLWDLTQIDIPPDDDRSSVLRGARDECYEAFDRELGRIVDAAPPEARILAFALHGMGPNAGWYERLPQLVACVSRGGAPAPPPKEGLVFRLRNALPWTLVRQVTRRIPHAWNKALVPLWSRRMFDWTQTKFFTLPMDYNGYIRLNVKGRELEGSVDPSDVEPLIAMLDEALRSFVDIETGKPVIRRTIKVDDLFGVDAPRRRFLPDMVVLWDAPFPSWQSSGVVSPTYGEVRWPKGERLMSGRSGNHTPNGWFVAVGPGIQPGLSQRTYDTSDLIPTVFEWLGAPRPDHFVGRPIEELTAKLEL